MSNACAPARGRSGTVRTRESVSWLAPKLARNSEVASTVATGDDGSQGKGSQASSHQNAGKQNRSAQGSTHAKPPASERADKAEKPAPFLRQESNKRRKPAWIGRFNHPGWKDTNKNTNKKKSNPPLLALALCRQVPTTRACLRQGSERISTVPGSADGLIKNQRKPKPGRYWTTARLRQGYGKGLKQQP